MSLSVQGGNSIPVDVRTLGRKCRDDVLERHLKKAGVVTTMDVLLARLAHMGEVHCESVRSQLDSGTYNEDLRLERSLEGLLCDVLPVKPRVLVPERQLCFLCQGHRIVNGRCMTCGMDQNRPPNID
jgi:hypothetical protein